MQRWTPTVRRLTTATTLVLTLAAASAAASVRSIGANPLDGESSSVTISILIDGPWVGNELVLAATKSEILVLTEGEFDVRFPDDQVRVGDWTFAGAQRLLTEALADPEVDLVIPWGLLGSHAACGLGSPPKPVVAPVVVDPRIQNCPIDEGGVSGVPGLSYVALQNTLRDELTLFQQVVPIRRVAILGYGEFTEAIPGLESDYLDEIRGAGFDPEFIQVGKSVDDALARLDDSFDAAYVWPQFQLSDAEMQRLVDGLNERRVPTFAALGGADLERGMLAAATPDDFFRRISRRVALNVQRILLGEPASEIPVSFATPNRLTLNMATARAIDVSPRWEALIDAELLFDEREGIEQLTLASTVTQALGANLDLAVSSLAVDTGLRDIDLARSNLRPSLDVGITASQIDEDRAEASFGSQAERTVSAGATLSQLLYSDAALGGVAIERSLQEGREYEYEAARLDIILAASTTYLNLLRAETLVAIQRSNVEVTRSNLDLARSRREVGAASSSEVFRWESQIATDRRSLIEAIADLRIAKISVNRLLHRDLAQPFETVEVGLDEPNLVTNQVRFRGYIETPRRFATFGDFIVDEAAEQAPELRTLAASIEAQERVRSIAKRAYYAPVLSLQLSLDEILERGGAGSDVEPAPGSPETDDTQWSLGLNGSLPLYRGGRRAAELAQAEIALISLRTRRASVREKLEESIRGGMEATRASYSGIGLSQQAAEAAGKSLELVSDAYSRGAVSIIDLIDAQNAALAADLQAANSVYDFLINLLNVQRATGRFDFFEPAADRDVWFDRLEAFFTERGIPPFEG